jgi:hypothetical protein
MTAPFTNQGRAAVNARVAIALLKRYRKRAEYKTVKPAILIGIVVADLTPLKLTDLRLALLSLNMSLLGGTSSKAWLQGVEYRDMLRLNFRVCFFADYKARRR